MLMIRECGSILGMWAGVGWFLCPGPAVPVWALYMCLGALGCSGISTALLVASGF
jgi:hypothetical protein